MPHLNKSQQSKIDQEVSKIFLQTNKSYPEDNLLDIVKSLDIKVYISDFGKHSEIVSGAIEPAKDNFPTKIYLNKNHSPERQTFTLAHELGHFMLHNGSVKYRIDLYNYATNSKEAKEETEANYFAASFLMPKDKFINLLKQSDDFIEVAKYFGVSESAARNRLRWIQINK